MIYPTLQQVQDWPNLDRYREANKKAGLPTPGETRIVLMGDSITEAWSQVDPDFFSANPYINRGISGQTTPQMLIRFRPDVVALQPKAAVILGGTNDIAGNTGPSSLQMIEDNLMSMAILAKAANISVILSSVLPANDFPWAPGMNPAEKIATLNDWIKSYSANNDCVFLDYYSSMTDRQGGMLARYSMDGVHPNATGYAVMAMLAEKAIGSALGK
ncbi:MAG: SGNH/GDSL hydrolase family protein [Ginsengibacter sp.]